MTATVPCPWSSPGSSPRPRIGVTPRVRKKSDDTIAAEISSGSPTPSRETAIPREAAQLWNECARLRQSRKFGPLTDPVSPPP